MTNPQFTAVIYTRVSRRKAQDAAEQYERSISVEDQERECRAVCERNGWPIRAVFCDDGISASRYGGERPEWVALKAELRAGDVLVLWEASRAQRDLAEFVALRDLCAGLGVPVSYSGRILDLSDGDDRFTAGLDALMDEKESERIKARVLRGKTSAAVAGKPAGPAPWGYRNAPRRAKAAPRWEPDPLEAPRVRAAVSRLIAGDSMCSVKKFIESTEGFKPSSLSNLRRALSNPALANLRVHRGEVVGEGTWEPLITREQHGQVLRALAVIKRSHGRMADPGPEPKRLLTGIATCVKCGTGLRYKRWAGKRNPGYVCPNGHACRVAHAMDAQVEASFFEMLPNLLTAAANLTGDMADADSSAMALAQITELEETLQDYIAMATRREISAASFAAIEKGLRAQIDALLPRTLPPDPCPDIEQVREAWPDMTMRDRRRLLRDMLTIVVVPAEKRGGRTGRLVITPGPFFADMNLQPSAAT